MKTMRCACNRTFQANTFAEIAVLSKKQDMEMFQKNDTAHGQAMVAMREIGQSHEAIQTWFGNKR